MLHYLTDRDPRELNTLSLCLIAIVLVALGVYAVKPFWLSYQGNSDKLALLRSSQTLSTSPTAASHGLKQEIARLEGVIDGDRRNLPSKEIESFVIGRLQTIAWRHALQLTSIEPSRGELTDDYQELLFQVTLSGGYFELGRWLHDLHRELGFVVVREFQLSENGGSARDPLLDARFLLSSYRIQSEPN